MRAQTKQKPEEGGLSHGRIIGSSSAQWSWSEEGVELSSADHERE